MTFTDSRTTYAASELVRLAPTPIRNGLLAAADSTKPRLVKPSSKPTKTPEPGAPASWKVFIFFLPGSGGSPQPPKLPGGKHWLELLLLLLKVAAALYALVKAVGVLGG